MIEQQGRVSRILGQQVMVRVGPATGCSACDRGEGCGAGAFSRLLKGKSIEFPLPASGNHHVGQRVRIGIPESLFLKLAMRIYGFPLLSGLAAGFAAQIFAGQLEVSRGAADLLVLGSAIMGFVLASSHRILPERLLDGAGTGLRLSAENSESSGRRCDL